MIFRLFIAEYVVKAISLNIVGMNISANSGPPALLNSPFTIRHIHLRKYEPQTDQDFFELIIIFKSRENYRGRIIRAFFFPVITTRGGN